METNLRTISIKYLNGPEFDKNCTLPIPQTNKYIQRGEGGKK